MRTIKNKHRRRKDRLLAKAVLRMLFFSVYKQTRKPGQD